MRRCRLAVLILGALALDGCTVGVGTPPGVLPFFAQARWFVIGAGQPLRVSFPADTSFN